MSILEQEVKLIIVALTLLLIIVTIGHKMFTCPIPKIFLLSIKWHVKLLVNVKNVKLSGVVWNLLVSLSFRSFSRVHKIGVGAQAIF